MKDESALGRQTTLRKTRGPRGQQHREGVVIVNRGVGLIQVLTIQQTAVSQIRRQWNSLGRAEILYLLRASEFRNAVFLKYDELRLERGDPRAELQRFPLHV